MAEEIVSEEDLSIARASKIISLTRSMYYYKSRRDDSELEDKLRHYAELYPSRGFPEYYKRIRREGLIWNHKRVRRVYLKLGLNHKRKIKRRVSNPEKEILVQPIKENITWSIDFMEDKLNNGRKIRTLNIIDDYNRECLAIDVDFSFPSQKVTESLRRIIQWRGKPESIRSDNGTEFTAKAFEGFCNEFGIQHIRTQKGKPMQNGYIERFNRTYREDVLDMYLFDNLSQVREITDNFMEDYNNNHPHNSLADKSPIEFLNYRKSIVHLHAVG